MNAAIRRLPGLAVAIVALALSASLAFAGQPASSVGLSRASSHAGKTVPVKADSSGDQQGVDEGTDETDSDNETDTETDSGTSDSGDNCTTDPTSLTPDQLAAMTHGQIVCWAAQQTSWDTTTYKNHGAFVSYWAHQGKGAQNAASHGKGHSH